MARPLVGRERELHAMVSLLAGIGERGTALVIRGEAGIGKSALVAEARPTVPVDISDPRAP